MPRIRHSIAIDVAAEKVFPLVSSGRGFEQWWAADVTETPGGVVELGFFKRGTVYALKPVSMTVPREAEWRCESGKEWSGTKLQFQLEPGVNRTLVRFTHADWEAESDYFVSCTTTWGELMFRLKAAAEGKAPGPLFSKDGLAY
jgi:hypothetical protein